MKRPPPPRTRQLTILAQDPSVRRPDGAIVRTRIEIPAEELRPGPWGYRVQVVDYDSSTDTFYGPLETGLDGDPFEGATDDALLAHPGFHAQNVYALVMRTLARFEFALGRRVSWGFYGHHLQVAPHAFADANAFYSRDDHALMFGYFPGLHGRTVFSCLSHDVVVHETTHALLDGLRERYNDPSSPDQAAFHEGFSDVVALLSVFSLPRVVEVIIDLASPPPPGSDPKLISANAIDVERLRDSGLLGLAEQMGQEMALVRGNALRRSVKMTPSRDYYASRGEYEDYYEPHLRGEILVAATMNAFLTVWTERLKTVGRIQGDCLDRSRVVEEGATIADILLTMAIRALDYSPPVDLQFGDFLSALLTSDTEIRPDDSRYELRSCLLESFRSYGIAPSSDEDGKGTWKPAPENLHYERTHFAAMQHDPDEVFRFIWENRQKLALCDDAYSRVLSVRPCVRIGPDGFTLHETVAEYFQILEAKAGELCDYRIRKPAGMPDAQDVKLYGGGALVFDEYGRLKFHVHNNVLSPKRQAKRLGYLWKYGGFKEGASAFRRISNIHRQRAAGVSVRSPEEW
jgi:hypothetical protein